VVSSNPHIGTLGEGPLHAALKQWYQAPGDRVEVPLGGFVIDLVRGDLLIEIQTRGFSSMKRKLASLLDAGHHVRVVHPIAVERRIVRTADDGTILSRRRSPKHGAATDIFAELVSFPDLLGHRCFEIEVLITVEEELRRHVPGRAWRRNGWVVSQRHLVDVTDSVPIRGIEDLATLVPDGLPEPFTTADLAVMLGRPRRASQQMAYCLRNAGVFIDVGKRGGSVLYRKV